MQVSNRIKPFLVYATLMGAVALLPTQAHAFNLGGGGASSSSNASSNASANAGAIGLGVGVGVGTGGTGGNVGNTTLNNTTEAGDYGDLRIVPPAIAPSVSNNIICPMVAQGSKAGSVFFFSGSGTSEPDLVPICIAWHLGQAAVVEAMACAAEPTYRKANANCIQDGETAEDRDFRLLKAKSE